MGYPKTCFLHIRFMFQPSSGVQKKPSWVSVGAALGLDYIIPIPWLYGISNTYMWLILFTVLEIVGYIMAMDTDMGDLLS